jgi:ribosomal-protein-serine acetyltransferase
MFRHHQIDEHLVLRLLATTDARELFELTDTDRARLRRWLPWVDGTTSVANSEAFVRAALRQVVNRQGFQAAIVIDGAIAGVIGHHQISWANRSTSLGYWLAAAHEGHGIMTRACRVLVQHAFTELDLHRVEIRCATGNTRSAAIPERLGFRREGVVREAEWLYDHFVDHVVYGLLRSEWSAAG